MNPDQEIERLSKLLEEQADTNETLAMRAAAAEVDWRLERAKADVAARLSLTKPTEGRVEAEVELQTTTSRRQYLTTKALAETGRDRLFALRAALDAQRTIAASQREARRG